MDATFKLYKCGECAFHIMLLPGLLVTCPDCKETYPDRVSMCVEEELEADTMTKLGIPQVMSDPFCGHCGCRRSVHMNLPQGIEPCNVCKDCDDWYEADKIFQVIFEKLEAVK